MQHWIWSIRSSLAGIVALCISITSILSGILPSLSLAVFISTSAGFINLASAQSVTSGTTAIADDNPPVINLEIIPRGIAGQEQVFTSLVSDNQQVQDVRLYYRFSGQQLYNSLPMESIGGSSYYVATVSPEGNDARDIEYYIQARDSSGNRAIEGFAFEPIVRELQPASVAGTTAGSSSSTTASSETTATPQSSGGVKLWQIVLAIAATGLLAGALSGGGSDGGGGNRQTVPLTLTIDSP